MLIENTLLGEINKEEIAIKRTIEFQNRDSKNKNILAFSGGKDSMVTYDILKRSGIEFEVIYSPPSVDAPELINFMKKYYPEVYWQPYLKDKKDKEITMWTLIPKKLMPPTRMVRYCCDVLKERTGDSGDTIYLGVRWAEGSKRSKQSMVGFWKKKIVVKPIIDWSDEEIWEYIRKYNLPYCKLYDQGWKRIGCIGCPLSSNQKMELDKYPAYRSNYISAFERMLEERKRKGKVSKWETGEEVMSWWLGENQKQKVIDGQCSIFGD
ncbi:phosphoadenosine phosphosulfate reductase family protein [Clostridium gasigenes]|uniref:phosphoadenosine phosphosulfate reductase family protein n=1 Tax=Clostridium gasigenes TaxID=94869 RepID=UPI001FABD079|nr:phosphoadenosine phosphosulfate reductase family protein [Clostridium gasigenes]